LKKLLAIFLILMLISSISGCTETKEDEDKDDSAAETISSENQNVSLENLNESSANNES